MSCICVCNVKLKIILTRHTLARIQYIVPSKLEGRESHYPNVKY